MEISYLSDPTYDFGKWIVMNSKGKVIAEFVSQQEAEDYMESRELL